jgi:membrane-bound lytic murein transglycosylase D
MNRWQLILLLGLAASRSFAIWEEWELDIDRIHEVSTYLMEEHAPPAWRDMIEIPPPAEWTRLWETVVQTLATGDFHDLAWIRPEVEMALELLRLDPRGEAYASWLEQRLDYFHVAHETVQTHAPAAHPPRPAPTVAAPLRPPPAPPPATPSPDQQQAMRQRAASRSHWDERLAGRDAPARAAALLPRLKQIFAAEGVPAELVWLAEVESTFNPSARSPVGAVGLFQFMPATAESFGLTTSPVDQRLDPELNAQAAARYLRQLYGRFQSWPLALAAYNAGQGRVNRLLREHQASTFDGISAHLPTETQMYVPKVMATIARREGVDPDRLPAPGTASARLHDGHVEFFRVVAQHAGGTEGGNNRRHAVLHDFHPFHRHAFFAMIVISRHHLLLHDLVEG